MEQIREHSLTHFCMTSLSAGVVRLDSEVEVRATAGIHMNYTTTIEEHLIDTLMPYASAASAAAEKEWREAWEMLGAESGYSEYVPTPAEKFNWQDVANMALHIGVGELVLLEFLVNIDSGLNLHNFSLEWEDETDEHCRTFLLVSPE